MYAVNWITAGFIAGVAFYPTALSLHCSAAVYRAGNLNARADGVADVARHCRQRLKFASVRVNVSYITENKCTLAGEIENLLFLRYTEI